MAESEPKAPPPDLDALKDRVSAARAEQARREATVERAEAEFSAAMEELRALGCETPEQAAAEIKRLDAELAVEVATIEEALAAAEGSS